MIERCEHFGFTLKASHSLAVIRKFIWQDLDRDFTFEFGISRTINFTHSAFAKQGNDFVRSQLCSDCDTHELCGDYIWRIKNLKEDHVQPLPRRKRSKTASRDEGACSNGVSSLGQSRWNRR